MKSLDQFVSELRGDVERFETHWRDQNKKRPKEWPMVFAEDDDGGWWEQFMAFVNQGR